MNPLAQATLKAGLVPADSLAELKRWRAPIDVPEVLPTPPETLEEAAAAISQALESEGFVMTRETDLGVFQQYLASQQVGTLCVHTDLNTAAIFPVSYGKTQLGEYIFPYRSEDIRDMMVNGQTYLSLLGGSPGAHPTNTTHIFFKDMRDVFYGSVRAFIVCTVSVVEVLPPVEKSDG